MLYIHTYIVTVEYIKSREFKLDLPVDVCCLVMKKISAVAMSTTIFMPVN